MTDVVKVALITGLIALLNGPILITIMNRRFRRSDDLCQLRSDIDRIYTVLDRIGEGLNIGLRNDKVIFKAFRENSINGESEAQERIMDDYLRQSTANGFKAKKRG